MLEAELIITNQVLDNPLVVICRDQNIRFGDRPSTKLIKDYVDELHIESEGWGIVTPSLHTLDYRVIGRDRIHWEDAARMKNEGYIQDINPTFPRELDGPLYD